MAPEGGGFATEALTSADGVVLVALGEEESGGLSAVAAGGFATAAVFATVLPEPGSGPLIRRSRTWRILTKSDRRSSLPPPAPRSPKTFSRFAKGPNGWSIGWVRKAVRDMDSQKEIKAKKTCRNQGERDREREKWRQEGQGGRKGNRERQGGRGEKQAIFSLSSFLLPSLPLLLSPLLSSFLPSSFVRLSSLCFPPRSFPFPVSPRFSLPCRNQDQESSSRD